MKCSKCGVNNANTHVKTVINGELREYDLCSECAQKMGYTSLFPDIQSDFTGLLSGFFSNALPARTQATRCEFCGSTYSEIAKTGQVGCAHCYELFADRLYPSIRRLHGNTTHCGKHSKAAQEAKQREQKPEEQTAQDRISAMKRELEQAVSEQNFELAAELRDKIREAEGK